MVSRVTVESCSSPGDSGNPGRQASLEFQFGSKTRINGGLAEAPATGMQPSLGRQGGSCACEKEQQPRLCVSFCSSFNLTSVDGMDCGEQAIKSGTDFNADVETDLTNYRPHVTALPQNQQDDCCASKMSLHPAKGINLLSIHSPGHEGSPILHVYTLWDQQSGLDLLLNFVSTE